MLTVQNHIEYFESDAAAAYPEVMETNYDDLTAQYGSVKNFLREKVGLTDADFQKLKELYLED